MNVFRNVLINLKKNFIFDVTHSICQVLHERYLRIQKNIWSPPAQGSCSSLDSFDTRPEVSVWTHGLVGEFPSVQSSIFFCTCLPLPLHLLLLSLLLSWFHPPLLPSLLFPTCFIYSCSSFGSQRMPLPSSYFHSFSFSFSSCACTLRLQFIYGTFDHLMCFFLTRL